MSYTFEAPQPKDPSADLDFDINWAPWLQVGESIDTSAWVEVGTTDLTLHDPSVSGARTIVWVSGGTPGQVYLIRNRIVTDSVPARTDDRTIRFKVRER